MDILELFDAAVENKASDMILTEDTPPTLRIDGDLHTIGNRPMDSETVKELVYSILEKPQIARFEKEKELDFSFTLRKEHRFRGNLYYQRGSVGGAFRLIPNKIPRIDELNLPQYLLKVCERKNGLFLITGATGMGKSTTLAAMIGEINRTRNCHVVTVEDPIEFIHENDRSVIDQREVGEDTHSFATAIRNSLRQSPDVILVGEMRDLDTIAAAITAAETGHLVLATLHTRDSSKSIDRIIDSFPSHQQNQIREQLSISLLGVLSQRLFPIPDLPGRIVATELLINNSAISHLIRDRKVFQIRSVLETHGKEEMHTFEASITKLVKKGLVYREDAEAFLGKDVANKLAR
ncbi:MAG: PilT/PilU family type 4a pilus ATPase [Planctomycetota bacterium]|nr:PilT/PilU family type 4a pilus ATPase [Planctomycetota bacterium]